MTLEVQFLPARQGDAIWIRWGSPDPTHQVLVDMGTESVGLEIRERLSKLEVAKRAFDLLVVTHVDRDHIGGVLTCVSDPAEPLEGLTFGDVWFNGWDHLHGRRAPGRPTVGQLEPMGAAQGERLAAWLRSATWNQRFDRGPVERGSAPAAALDFPDDLSLTVLGPTRDRLEGLIDTWKDEVETALARGALDADEVSEGLHPPAHPGLESYGSKGPPVLADASDLELLAQTHVAPDSSRTNGSTISLLLKWREVRILLCGDAHPDDLVEDLTALGGGQPVRFDVVKLPHHGSARNVTDELVRSVTCPYWVFSSDGTTFRHPDAIAIARILHATNGTTPILGFNVPSESNRWWDRDDWRDVFDYLTEYGTADDGLTLRFT